MICTRAKYLYTQEFYGDCKDLFYKQAHTYSTILREAK
jgi:hypothetical protein